MADATIIQNARDAKGFISESGEAAVPDETLVRAAVAFNMLERRGMIAKVRADEGFCRPHAFDGFDRAHAIALIAHNFDDHPPSTPGRKDLFETKLLLPWSTDGVSDG